MNSKDRGILARLARELRAFDRCFPLNPADIARVSNAARASQELLNALAYDLEWLAHEELELEDVLLSVRDTVAQAIEKNERLRGEKKRYG